jgi:hypothetical protein
MKTVSLCVAALAAAVTMASVAAAGPDAAKQWVTITAKGKGVSSSGKFVLTPVRAGKIESDSGTETSVVRNQRVVVREGQSAKIVTWVTTAQGKLGSFVIRARIEQIDAGNGFHVGTGTWTFVRGTGKYADITGGGRVANAWVEGGSRPWTERRDGFLTLP